MVFYKLPSAPYIAKEPFKYKGSLFLGSGLGSVNLKIDVRRKLVPDVVNRSLCDVSIDIHCRF